jgi:peptidoglycan hydrolase-like protein with peptidoglycan-binding domain
MANPIQPPASSQKPISVPPKVMTAPAKPVASIHGESSLHHSHWGLIAGILGVFLVLETIFLGYSLMRQQTKKSTLDTAVVNDQTSASAIETSDIQVVTDPTNDAQSAAGLFTYLSLNPAVRKLEAQDQITWLRSQIALEPGSDTACLTVTPEISETVIADWFNGQVSEIGLTRLMAFEQGYQSDLYKVCRGQASAYAIVFDQSGFLATVAIYDSAKEYWNAQQPVMVNDGYILLYPDINVAGTPQPVIVTGMADAGTWAWKFWTPTPSQTLQLIEDCASRDIVQLNTDGVESTTTSTLECQVEFVETYDSSS